MGVDMTTVATLEILSIERRVCVCACVRVCVCACVRVCGQKILGTIGEPCVAFLWALEERSKASSLNRTRRERSKIELTHCYCLHLPARARSIV